MCCRAVVFGLLHFTSVFAFSCLTCERGYTPSRGTISRFGDCGNVTCDEELFGKTERCFALAYELVDVHHAGKDARETRGCLWLTEYQTVHAGKIEEEMVYHTLSDVLTTKSRSFQTSSEAEVGDTIRVIGGYICDTVNCNDAMPNSAADTAVTVALFLLIAAFFLVVLVIVIIIFHFLMWELEKLHNVDTSKGIRCR